MTGEDADGGAGGRESADGADGQGDADGAGGQESADGTGTDLRANDGDRFDRLPATDAERVVAGRPSRAAVVGFFEERYGIPGDTFSDHTFWEKGAGKVWAFAGESPDPAAVQALGMTVLRTRQEHPKPTTEAAQRFGRRASRNVVELSPAEARRFLAGEDGPVDWDGDWGYLIAAHELAGAREPIGVGLYLHGELRSMVPKGRRREL